MNETNNQAKDNRLAHAIEDSAKFMIETGRNVYLGGVRYFAEIDGTVKIWDGFGRCPVVGHIRDGKFIPAQGNRA